MFTGIIEAQAVLRERKKNRSRLRLTFEFSKPDRFRKGESVAVEGVCLTVTDFSGRRFSADVIPETVRSTTLGRLRIGQSVNVERPLRMGDRVGGHWVTGHVDGVGRIRKKEKREAGLRLQIEAPADIIRLLVEKGSIAIDGISFTLQGIQKDSFTVGVTPRTARVTTLGQKQVGDSVNLENDLFIKSTERILSRRRVPC